ncbi:MAG: AraC family transcriptional regulator ligand-binding domain-containing protein, partial [Candidatus Binatia bacterium]
MAGSVARALFDEVGRVAADMGYRVDDAGPTPPARRLHLRALLTRLADLERQSGDPSIGLRLGRQLAPVAVGVPGYLAMAGPTLLDALPRVMACQQLVAEGVRLRFVPDDDVVRFHLAHPGVAPRRVLSDLLVSAMRVFGVWLLGSQPPLSDVWFHYPRPADRPGYEELFGVAPRFGAADDGFALARAWVSAPLRTAEASLVPVLQAQATRLLASIREDAFLAGVSEVVVDRFASGEAADVGAVAGRLHTSPRTLQRRLRDHGLTFNRLVQEVRRDLAERYLADERLSLVEVAGLL